MSEVPLYRDSANNPYVNHPQEPTAGHLGEGRWSVSVPVSVSVSDGVSVSVCVCVSLSLSLSLYLSLSLSLSLSFSLSLSLSLGRMGDLGEGRYAQDPMPSSRSRGFVKRTMGVGGSKWFVRGVIDFVSGGGLTRD